MTHLSRRRVLTSSVVVLASLTAARATDNAGPLADKRLALKGYDPVSYFTEGRPVKGSAEFWAVFDDATYWFESAEHRAMFTVDPDRYAPQYGGLCAISLAHGRTIEPDPEAWTIADGKLYVFGVKEGVALFQDQAASIVGKAAEQWAALHKMP
jgi:YHS domain-containing protein